MGHFVKYRPIQITAAGNAAVAVYIILIEIIVKIHIHCHGKFSCFSATGPISNISQSIATFIREIYANFLDAITIGKVKAEAIFDGFKAVWNPLRI